MKTKIISRTTENENENEFLNENMCIIVMFWSAQALIHLLNSSLHYFADGGLIGTILLYRI